MMLARQLGLTLAELMVALLLGLLATLAAGSMLVAANRTFGSHANGAALDEGGRFAIDLIARAARQSAYVNLDRDDAGELADAVPARTKGLDARSLGRDSPGLDGAQPAVANGSDVLALRFAGSGPAPDGDGSVLSCAGFPVHADEDGWSIFFVALSAGGTPELRCKYRSNSGWSADALVAGVDSFQVLYGIDTDGDGLANGYLSASAVDALDGGIVPAGTTEDARGRDFNRRSQWKRVVSLKVALLLHGEEAPGAPLSSTEYRLFGPAYSGAGDPGTTVREADMERTMRQRERRLFAATIMLRNAGQ